MLHSRYLAMLCCIAAGSAAQAAEKKSKPVSPAQAARAAFTNCDGYGVPSRTKDGISQRPADSFTLTPVSERHQTSLSERMLGGDGVAACDTALADPRLLPEHKARRASLLRARAAYRLMLGDPSVALRDLDESDREAAGADPYFKRSFGLGSKMLRAFALFRTGDKAGAASLAASTAAERPYDPNLAAAGARVRLAASEDWAAYRDEMRRIASVQPAFIDHLFAVALVEGRFDDMIALRPHAMPNLPDLTGIPDAERTAQILAANIHEDSRLDGETAYALAATGKHDEAIALLDRARARIAEIRPPAADPSGRPPGKAALARQAANEAQAAKAREEIEKSARLVALRLRITQGGVEDALAEMKSMRLDPTGVAGDLFEAVGRARPALRAEADAALAELARVRARLKRELVDLDLRYLVSLLPIAESRGRIAAYNGGSNGLLSLDTTGFNTRQSRLEGLTRVRFDSLESSGSVVGEMALLRAAELARKAGKKGVIVVSRRSVQRTTMTYYYSRLVNTRASGFITYLDVAFVDPAALPAEYAQAGWRVLDADDIWTKLAPIYVTKADPA